jgi:hypothetical protein
VNQEIEKLRATGPLGALVMGNVVKQANQQAQEEGTAAGTGTASTAARKLSADELEVK